jgi:hypothetical protein
MHQPAASSYARSIGVDMDVVALPVVWLTDIDVRSRDDAELIGLGGSPIAVCNRIEYRFRVPGSPSIRPWGEWADERLPELVEGDVWRTLIELERAPARWWVSEDPIPGVRLDERYRPWTT